MRRLRSLFAASLTIAMLSSCGGGNDGASSPPPPVLASITVTPANGTLELGSNQTFTATGTLTDNSTEDVTQTATWSSNDSTVLLLDNSAGRIGVANTRGPGMATVTAAVGSIKGTTQATVVRPTPKFLYAASKGVGIAAFRVDPTTGSLTAIGTPYSPPNNPVSLAVTRDSKFLYTAEYSAYFTAWAIQADGSLVPAPGSPFPNPDVPTAVVAHPTADFLYVSTKAGVTVYGYDPASGTPTLKSSVVIGDIIFTELAAIAPDGSYFYQTASGHSSRIAGFSVDSASGALSVLPGGPVWDPCFNPEVPNGPYPTQVVLDPAGKFLYAAIEGGFQPAYCPLYSFPGYSIDPASGAMTQITGSPFGAGENPVSVAVEASGRFLFVANVGGISISGGAASTGVSVYSVNPDTGVPTEVAGSPFPTADIPGFVVADPSGLYLYVGTGTGILGFTIDQTTGALVANPGATAAINNVQFIAVTH
jgi:hypothetical protein